MSSKVILAAVLASTMCLGPAVAATAAPAGSDNGTFSAAPEPFSEAARLQLAQKADDAKKQPLDPRLGTRKDPTFKEVFKEVKPDRDLRRPDILERPAQEQR